MITTIENTREAQLIQEPAEAYHLRREISRGMLADLFESPRLYEGRYILGNIPPKEATPLMIKGSLAHAALLEPRKFQDRYVVMPDFQNDPENVTKQGQRSNSTATTYYQTKKAAFEQQNEGLQIVTAAEYEMIAGMSAALARECGAWLDVDGIVEQTLTWIHPATGLPCRCRVDWARYTKRGSVIGFDLKGTTDPTPRSFRNRIIDGLWLQRAHYAEGLEIVLGMPVDEFFFVACEFDRPHRTFAYPLDPASARMARDAREELMFDLAQRLGSGDFSDPQEGKVVSISVPDFAFKRGE